MSTTTTTTTFATQKINGTVTKLELESYNSCKIWLEGYNSPATKNAYKIHLSRFCKYHNIDPNSLIQLKPEQIKTMVLNYIIHLKRNAKQSVGKAKRGEISVNSVKEYLAGLQSFLDFNEILLNWKKIQRSLSYFTDVIYWNKSRSYQGRNFLNCIISGEWLNLTFMNIPCQKNNKG